ncbi:MAG: bifunctional metallophosphatase/5'-nucleotidase, partial [Bacteroidales bacterium]|nr:bifunctional metallophosphatase/5'-nucleotidase [Bacteroidales bacterium]
GDFLQGGSLGAASKGGYIVEVMNSVGYDAVTLGNHEFDYGMERLGELSEVLTAEIVDCNLSSLETGDLLYKPYKIFSFGGVDVAILGISTPYSFASSLPSHFQDEEGNMLYSLSTYNIYNVVQHYVDEAREEGAEYVIAIAHLGDDEAATEINSWELAAETSGIDVILDGHSHSTVPERHLTNKSGSDVIVSSTGEYFNNIGRLTISPDGQLKTELIERESIENPDQNVEAVIEKVKQEYDALGKRPIGTCEEELVLAQGDMPRAVRFQEMGLGNFCVDAIRDAMHTDVAIMGGGSVRAPIHKGELTFNDIFSVFPFGNTLAVGEISGRQLVDVLEFSVYALPIEFGGFLQVSGIKFSADLRVDSPVTTDSGMKFTGFSGEKRRVSNVRILNSSGKYEPVDLDRMYTISGLNFLLKEHGDGYEVLSGVSVTDTGMADIQILENYIVETLGGVIPARYAKPEGRITLRK